MVMEHWPMLSSPSLWWWSTGQSCPHLPYGDGAMANVVFTFSLMMEQWPMLSSLSLWWWSTGKYCPHLPYGDGALTNVVFTFSMAMEQWKMLSSPSLQWWSADQFTFSTVMEHWSKLSSPSLWWWNNSQCCHYFLHGDGSLTNIVLTFSMVMEHWPIVPMTSVNIIFLFEPCWSKSKIKPAHYFWNMVGSQNYFSMKILFLKINPSINELIKLYFILIHAIKF